jgi:hypothetical protein
LLTVKPGETRGKKQNQQTLNEWLAFQKTLGDYAKKTFGVPSGGEQGYNWLDVFFTNYEQRLKGEEIDQLVNAIIGLYNAESAYDEKIKNIVAFSPDLCSAGR